MGVNAQRIRDLIESLAEINATPGKGVSRFSYTDEDRRARKIITDKCESIGLTAGVDAIGNIRVKYAGLNDNLSPVWIGSHIDSVKNGGRFDGICGVVSALEVLLTLHDENTMLPRSVELVIFAEEEGSNFGTTMLGSKAMTGKCDEDYLHRLRNETGEDAYTVIKRSGFDPSNLESCRIGNNDIYAMVELHIEQGRILDEEHLKIGVVEAIAGMHTYKISVSGSSDHAGATPMDMRRDPMAAAAKIITALEDFANQDPDGTAVATVGSISCLPGMSNVIASSVVFSVDIRDVKESGIDDIVKKMRSRCSDVESSDNVSIDIELVGKSSCIVLSQKIADIIENSVMDSTLPYRRMNSGAVHDAAMLASITDVGMIFIPSVYGKSHCPEEYTSFEDISAGAGILLNVVKKLASG